MGRYTELYIFLANPKSATFSTKSSVMRIFLAAKSRWMHYKVFKEEINKWVIISWTENRSPHTLLPTSQCKDTSKQKRTFIKVNMHAYNHEELFEVVGTLKYWAMTQISCTNISHVMFFNCTVHSRSSQQGIPSHRQHAWPFQLACQLRGAPSCLLFWTAGTAGDFLPGSTPLSHRASLGRKRNEVSLHVYSCPKRISY